MTALIDEILKTKISFAQIERETGVSADRMYQWKQNRGNPKAEDSEKLQNWLKNRQSIPQIKDQSPETELQIISRLTKQLESATKEKDDLYTRLDYLSKMEVVSGAKIAALEDFVMQLGSEIRKTDLKTQSVALGKIEGAWLRRRTGTHTDPQSREGMSDKKKKATV